jgi:tetratricopeptide (TPR) repeat protein
MPNQEDLLKAHALAQTGAKLLSGDPFGALECFEKARAVARTMKDARTSSDLACMAARAQFRLGRLSRAIKSSRDAVKDLTSNESALYTLAHFCEVAAGRSACMVSKRRRALFLYLEASRRLAERAKLVPIGEREAAEGLALSAQDRARVLQAKG